MINLSTPILQIKTTGFKLSDIKAMDVSIMTQTEEIKKENENIEIDNDIILVSLTHEEANKLKGDASISVMATDYNGMDVSQKIKLIWTKRGSRAGGEESGGFVTNATFKQIVSRIDESVKDLENELSVGEEKFYFDFQNGKYGFNTDPNRGADTFVPFRSGEDAGENVVFIDSVYDSPANIFSTMTQIGVYNQRVIEINPYWTKLFESEEVLFTENYEKITVVVQEV